MPIYHKPTAKIITNGESFIVFLCDKEQDKDIYSNHYFSFFSLFLCN